MGTVKNVHFLHILPDRLWDPPSLLFSAFRVSFARVKRPGCEVDHSLATDPEVENAWLCTYTPPVRLHHVDRDFAWGSLLPRIIIIIIIIIIIQQK